jgi:hypothetical protein
MLSIKNLHAWIWLSMVTLVPACSFHQTPVALQPVGPAPMEESSPSLEGTLVVYSDLELFSDPPPYFNQHSSYTIASDDGKLVKHVPNHLAGFDEGPQPIALAPGSYTVTARSANFGRIEVPVVIKGRHTTFVYLDGQPHLNAPSTLQSNVVKLPDGQIVGWTANATAN